MKNNPTLLGKSPPGRIGQAESTLFLRWPVLLIVFSAFAFLTQFLLVGPGNEKKARESDTMQATCIIALAMFQYANDNDGKYPTGHSSTEIFQKLIDENYVSHPATFYVAMSGKTRPTSNKLKPENVSYDVTVPVDSHSPDGLPIVFLTGYRIEYQPNGSAISLPSAIHPFAGLAACYHSNNARFILPHPNNSGPNIDHVLPSDFDPQGQHFQQLTPDGPLPPG